MRRKGILVLIGLIVGFGLVFTAGCRLQAKRPGIVAGGTPGAEREAAKSRLDPVVVLHKCDELALTVEDASKYYGHMCPCVIAGFRAVQLAALKLWGGKAPDREDFKVVTKWPGKGSHDAIEFVTRARTRGELALDYPAGATSADVDIANFVFIITRKSTGAAIRIQVKKSVIPEVPGGFFALKKKVKIDKTATPEEAKMFKAAAETLIKRMLKLPVDGTFTYKSFPAPASGAVSLSRHTAAAGAGPKEAASYQTD